MTEQEILKTIEELNIRFIRLQFTDINGTLKNIEIPSGDIEKAIDKGIMFDGSSIEGFVRIHESDMYLKPALSTFAVLPWTATDFHSARMICDIYMPDGAPFDGDPRYRLRLVTGRAAEMGFEPYAGPEVEFFLLPRENGKPVFEYLDEGGYFDLLPVDIAEFTRSEVAVHLKDMNIDVEATHHEAAPSQHEIDFRYTELLSAADNVQTVKLVIKTLAVNHKLHATFMPKPFFGVNGSGMHVHISLLSKDDNLFYDSSSPDGISEMMKFFIGGIIRHARGITAITNPTVNSYKRIVPGYEAPVDIAWSLGNRTALIRIPMARGHGTRLEYRSPDTSCNTYLALAVIVGAGLDGVEKKIQPSEPVGENIWDIDEDKRNKMNIESLPANLGEALDEMENDPLIKEILGEHIYEKFLKMKRAEWDEYNTQVTRWERQKYENI